MNGEAQAPKSAPPSLHGHRQPPTTHGSAVSRSAPTAPPAAQPSQPSNGTNATETTSTTTTARRPIPTSFNPRAPNASSPARPTPTSSQPPSTPNAGEDWVTSTSHAFEESIARPASEALHSFFYPPVRERDDAYTTIQPRHGGDETVNDAPPDTRERSSVASSPTSRPASRQSSQRTDTTPNNRPRPRRRRNPSQQQSRGTAQQHEEFDEHFQLQQQQDKKFVEKFWTGFDDIIILSLFTQVGIVARLAVSTWFTVFDGVFSNDSPLFVNLPLNCLSCFLLGLLASGESLMEIIATRFSPPRLQQVLHERKLQARRSRRDRGKDDASKQSGGASDGASSSSADEFINLGGRTASQDSIHRHDNDSSSDDGVVMMQSIDHNDDQHLPQSQWLRRRRRRRRKRRSKRTRTSGGDRPDRFWWEPPVRLDEELRDVQLLALERRIRQSKCLLLFPLKKEDVDVMEHYFDEGYQKDSHNEHDNQEEKEEEGDMDAYEECKDEVSSEDVEEALARDEMRQVMDARRSLENDLALEESEDPELARKYQMAASTREKSDSQASAPPAQGNRANQTNAPAITRRPSNDSIELHGQQPEAGTDLNQIVHEVSANVTENISRLQRAPLADGWDVGTTPEAMSDDLMLGLRLGFCGALSSFSSWNSAMINLILEGHIGDAVVGYMLGLQLPIVAYRFGQHVAVFVFIWRCRRETKRDERRGYGIQVAMNENSERDEQTTEEDNLRESSERETPSIRAVATALFVMALVTQGTSIFFYTDPESQVVALSLLFSPLGVIARWRLARYNSWRPTFPMGTFVCNILACALSGGMGNLLAGNPGERERLVLVSFINGFGGTLSSVAAFIVEILAGVDPVLLRFDGIVYAFISIFWAMVVGFIFTASADWADETG